VGAWRLTVMLAVVAPALVHAQPADEFSLPSFGPPPPDAGTATPTPPPLPPPDAVPAAPPEWTTPVPAPHEEPKPGPPKPPPDPKWNRVAGTVSGLFVALTNIYLGGEVSFLAGFGAPTRSQAEPTTAEGFLMQVGVQGSWGKLTGPVCLGSSFCGTRYAFGAAAKGGWASGTPDKAGWTKAGLMFYAQVDLLAGFLDIPSAPLVPGASTWEAVGRLRLGAHYSALGATAVANKVTLNGAFVVEAIPASATARGVSIGVALGVAF
jgi:hypothetical protein